MTNIEAKAKAVEIVKIIWEISIEVHYDDAVIAAILQVKSNIALLKEVRYRKKLQDYELILSELEKM